MACRLHLTNGSQILDPKWRLPLHVSNSYHLHPGKSALPLQGGNFQWILNVCILTSFDSEVHVANQSFNSKSANVLRLKLLSVSHLDNLSHHNGLDHFPVFYFSLHGFVLGSFGGAFVISPKVRYVPA